MTHTAPDPKTRKTKIAKQKGDSERELTVAENDVITTLWQNEELRDHGSAGCTHLLLLHLLEMAGIGF